MQASRDRCRSAILEIIMLGSLRVGRWGATSKIGFDHVGEDDARLGDVEGSDGRVHLVEALAAAQKFFFFQAEDGIRDIGVTGVQTCALPISQATLISCMPRQMPSTGRSRA